MAKHKGNKTSCGQMLTKKKWVGGVGGALEHVFSYSPETDTAPKNDSSRLWLCRFQPFGGRGGQAPCLYEALYHIKSEMISCQR